jgi:AcrR family transcriptional regulator
MGDRAINGQCGRERETALAGVPGVAPDRLGVSTGKSQGNSVTYYRVYYWLSTALRPIVPSQLTMAATKTLRWERRPDSRPNELLDAALAVFAERGYRNTRIDDVAEAAGVTKGAVYHYFDTKQELLLRAIEHHHERTFGEIEELLSNAGGPVSARIRLMLRKAFGPTSTGGRRMTLAVILQGVRHELPEAHEQWLRGGPIKGWKLLASLIEEGKSAGEFRADVDSEVAARITIAGLITQMVWQASAPDVAELLIDEDRLIDSAVELLLHGLLPAVVVATATTALG